MPTQLDTPTTSNRPPVIGARGLGQTVTGMVCDKEMRPRLDKDQKPILNSRGRPAQEEILTIIIMDPTSGVVAGGDLDPDWTPDPGTVCRLIFKGLQFGRLIDARNKIGATQVGDVITVTATTATIWRGAGDKVSEGVVDEAAIARARTKGLSIGWETEITYRRPTPTENHLVDRAEAVHSELRTRITLDPPKNTPDNDDAF